MSEKSITAPKLTDEPIMIKIKNISLYVILDLLEEPNKKKFPKTIQDYWLNCCWF